MTEKKSGSRPGRAPLGQYGPPSHLLVHLSDTHFLAGGAKLHGRTDTDVTLVRAIEQLEGSGLRPNAIVVTGDVADLGEADAYQRVRGLLEPAAARLGADLVWVMGNHDERSRFRSELLGVPASATPYDRVLWLNGLRLIVLDTTVPGYHHGELDAAQLEWLRAELSAPAEHGTLLALHHPPIPTPLPLMEILELQRQDELAAAIEGSDVRGILGGHMHYSTSASFAGVPVNVAAATCYTMDVSGPTGGIVGANGGQSFSLVEVHERTVVHSVVPIGDFDRVTLFDAEFLARMEALAPAERLEAFSRQLPPPE